jgi:Apea-like HEPN
MSLKPAETVERILISSTSRFVAEYESAGVVITHAWPSFRNPTSSLRMKESPLSRSAFMLSFIVREVPRRPGDIIPNYEGWGEIVCSLLSLLYGKRFDSHGRVQSHGSFFLPHLAQFNSLRIPKLPQNDHSPRSDIAVPLDLRQIARLSPILTRQVTDSAKATALKSAAKFYHQALQNGETDPEVAYLHLITAGEILASTHCPQSADHLDDSVRAILDQVTLHIPDGETSAKILANRMRQIQRRFYLTVEDLVDEQFFSAIKNKPDRNKFKKDDFSKRVSASYDIRSRYVHTGVSFGEWIAPRESLEEVRVGLPHLEDREYAKLLQLAPTYIGLERVIRYCLIRFAERYKLIVDAAS